MDSEPLVSIVTPCYNGASFISRFFQSLIDQAYQKIELIFVDDGSTDHSYEIAESWRGRLESRGIRFKLIRQDNAGQAAALNAGFPHVSGKYIVWPDCDDLLSPENIEKKVSYLESHPEKGLVACDVVFAMEDDLATLVRQVVFDDSKPRLFDSLIREEGNCFCSGIAYMARTDALFSAIGGRHIYESRSGQNWQLLFPLTYHYDCGFIHEPLATYVVRANSHSRSYTSLEAQLTRTYELQDIIDHVLPAMGMSEDDYARYAEYVSMKFLPRRFVLAVRMGNAVLAKDAKVKLDSHDGFSLKRAVMMMLCRMGLGPVCFELALSVKNAVDNSFGRSKQKRC